MVMPALNYLPIYRSLGLLQSVFGLLPVLQAHPCLKSQNNSRAHHPQVRQCKHHQQLAGFLGQAPVTRLAASALNRVTFADHPKRSSIFSQRI